MGRYEEIEGASSPHIASYPDSSPAGLHDLPGHREAEARSLPRLFRGEEGIEDTGEEISGDSVPCVGQGYVEHGPLVGRGGC